MPPCQRRCRVRFLLREPPERCCLLAGRMAERLAEGGATIANDVVLNQVLVGFGDLCAHRPDRRGGAAGRTCWLGATTWHDQRLIRISVSNATTTEADIDASAAAILAAADSVGRGGPKGRHETPCRSVARCAGLVTVASATSSTSEAQSQALSAWVTR